MLEHHYDLVIQHHASVEPVDHLVRDLLVLLDKEGDPYIEYKLSEGLLFPESKTAVLENITQDEAEYYQKRFREMMVETSIRPTLQQAVETLNLALDDTKDLHTCPACQHQQPRSKSGMNTCQNCNLVAEKYQRQHRREDNPPQESGVYQFQRDKLMREALERARSNEEEQLRREARLQLSLESKKRPLDIAIGVSAIALMLLAGILIITSIQRKAPSNPAPQAALALKNLEGAAGPNTKTLAADRSEPTQNLTDKTNPEPLQETALSSTQTHQPLTQTQIEQLKNFLDKDRPNPYLNKLSPEQFKTDHQKLERLLELNKPELAVAFVNQLNDQYAAALMLLKIASSEIKQNHHSNDADILRTFNHLLSRAPAIQQPLVSANFSLLLHLQGQSEQAYTLLATTLADLKSTNNSLLFTVNNKGDSAQTQKLGIVLQIIKDYHRFAPSYNTQVFIKVAEEILATSPSDLLAQTQGMTLLAAACLVLGDQTQALAWLNKIPDLTAREQLLAKLQRLAS